MQVNLTFSMFTIVLVSVLNTGPVLTIDAIQCAVNGNFQMYASLSYIFSMQAFFTHPLP